MILGLSAVSMTGCGAESILSATAKILGGQISQLTAGEIQILNQTALNVIGSTLNVETTPLTLAQAEAVSSFLKINDLNTIDDFTTLASQAESNPESIEGLDDLADAFQGTDFDDEGEFDPSQLGNLFQAILGGVNTGGGGGTGGGGNGGGGVGGGGVGGGGGGGGGNLFGAQ